MLTLRNPLDQEPTLSDGGASAARCFPAVAPPRTDKPVGTPMAAACTETRLRRSRSACVAPLQGRDNSSREAR